MMFSKRWDYWLKTLDAGKVLDEPIPQIKWTGSGHPDARKNLEKCLDMIHNRGRRESLDLFVDWLLHGFGDRETKELPRGLEPKVSADWYKTFNLGLYLQHPHDYLGCGPQAHVRRVFVCYLRKRIVEFSAVVTASGS